MNESPTILMPDRYLHLPPLCSTADVTDSRTKPTLAEVRAGLVTGVPGAAATDAVTGIRGVEPGFPATIAAEDDYRDTVIGSATRSGIRHFVVVGPGLPPSNLAHDVVRNALPEGEDFRVLYVTGDAGVQARLAAAGTRRDQVRWSDPAGMGIDVCVLAAHHQGFLTFDEPVCVLAGSTLQHIHCPEYLISGLWGQLPHGSRMSITQIVAPRAASTAASRLEQVDHLLLAYTGTSLMPRSAAEMRKLFAHWEIVDRHVTTPVPSGQDPVGVRPVAVMNMTVRATLSGGI
ncbi:MAG TPA: SAM-dependent methyltransferase [Amycolatopsis sp.]|nr:SAM-dependent methyltransferase [Amycolatopsis sp.]